MISYDRCQIDHGRERGPSSLTNRDPFLFPTTRLEGGKISPEFEQRITRIELGSHQRIMTWESKPGLTRRPDDENGTVPKKMRGRLEREIVGFRNRLPDETSGLGIFIKFKAPRIKKKRCTA
jgi:hypothetical protein